MATCAQTIKSALRKLRVIPMGTEPSAEQAAEGLQQLEELTRSWLGFGASHPVVDQRLDTYYVLTPDTPSVRFFALGSSTSITLPQEPRDGARVLLVDAAGTLAANPITLIRSGLRIEGLAADLVLNTNNMNRMWTFRADLADWTRASDLTLLGEIPFPSDFDDAIALLLARAMGNSYGVRLGPDDNQRADEAENRLSGRYVAPLPFQFDSATASMGGATRYGWWAPRTNGWWGGL